MADNPFDQFDAPSNAFDQFDKPKEQPSGNPLTNWLSAAPEGNSPDKRTLGTGEAVERAATGRGAALLRTLGDYNPLSATAALARKVTGQPDVAGNALGQFSKEQEINPQTEQYASNAQRVGAGLAGLAPDIVAAMATRGGSLLEGVAPRLAEAPGFIQRGAEGLASMTVPALTTGRETYERAREHGEGVLEAGTKALKAGGETLLGGAGPAGPTGGVIKRVIGGAATNAAVAEGMRRLHNAISPESEQEAYDPSQTISAAVLGGTLHGAFGPRAKENTAGEPKPEATPAYTPAELTAMADQRIAELGAKKTLTPAEQEEHQFLQANRTDHDELADRLGADVKPEQPEQTPTNKQPPNEPPPPPGTAPVVDEDKVAEQKPVDLVAARQQRDARIDELEQKRESTPLTVDEHNELHDLNRQQALTNPLSGLPNKKAFDQDLNAGDHTHAVSMDIQKFKAINDTYGHGVGDQILQAVGGLLGRNSGDALKFYHLSGDEFTALGKGDPTSKLSNIRDTINGQTFDVQMVDKDGNLVTKQLKGIDLPFGVSEGKGRTAYEQSDVAANEAKNKLYADSGERRRASDIDGQLQAAEGSHAVERDNEQGAAVAERTEEPVQQPTGAETAKQPAAATEPAAGTERAAEPERGTGAESVERDDTGGNQPGGAARVGPERISRVTPSGKDIGFRTQKEAALGVAKRGFDPADYRITKDDNGGFVATRRDNEQNRRAFAEGPGTQPVPESGGIRGSARVLAEPRGTAPAFSRREDVGREPDGSLRGLPRKVGGFVASAFPKAHAIARDYAQKSGIPYNPPTTYAKVNPERATRIAKAYEEMKHDPHNPDVQRAYNKMIDETMAQYKAIKDTGLKVDFIKPGQADPYEGNPRKMTEDVRKNNHMWVFSTKDGFGSDATFDPSENPLLRNTGEKIGGQPALANDIFRVVHDYFGHVKEGVGFRADGEENAWRAHSAMYSPEARRAMTSETRGQNSWVNYGPHGEHNRTASPDKTIYADQKVGLLPDWVVSEGANDEAPSFQRKTPEDARAALDKYRKFITSDEFARMTKQGVAKFIDVFKNLPSAKNFANAALAGAAKRGWYRDSTNAIIGTFGHADAPRFAALLAATSPQTSVESNLFNALHIWRNWNNEGRPTDLNSIRRIMGDSVQQSPLEKRPKESLTKLAKALGLDGSGGRQELARRIEAFSNSSPESAQLVREKSVLPAWLPNTVRALSHENPGEVDLSGPKVNSFMLNLRGNVNEVTNDTWMANFAGVKQSLFSGAKLKGEDVAGKGAGYIAYSARVREAAQLLSKETGGNWTPAEVQETVWSWAKTAAEEAEKRGVNIANLVKSGGVSDDIIKATPAFGDLFNEREYRTIIEAAGLGDALDRYRARQGEAAGGVGAKAATRAPDTRELVKAANRLQRAKEGVDEAVPFQRREANENVSGVPAGLAAHADASSEKLGQAISRFTGKPAKFLSVDRSALPDALSRALRAFEEATGTKINLIRNLTPEHEDFNAVTLKDGTLHVNEAAANPITVGAVHEFGHELRETHPELWDELANEVERQGLLSQWVKEAKRRGYAEGTDFTEELTNDAISDAFHNPQFLDRLAQANPSVFSRVAQAFKAFIDSFLGKFRDAGSGRYLTDVEAFRSKLLDVMRRYGVPEAEAHANERAAASRAPSSDFYSALHESIDNAVGAPKKGGAALKQWLDGAQRRGEFKGSERQWLGVDSWLDSHPDATRQELADFVKLHQVQVTPVKRFDKDVVQVYGAFPKQFETVEQAQEYVDRLNNAAKSEPGIASALERHPLGIGTNRGGNTKFGQYTLPGGENYREHLLTLPEKSGIRRDLHITKSSDGWFEVRDKNDGEAALKSFRTKDGAEKYIADLGTEATRKENFRSGHFDEPNILAHVRMNDRTTADGAKALHIEEIQSDWHQKGRREGYAKDTTGWTAHLIDGGPEHGFSKWRVDDANGNRVTDIVGPTKESAIRKAAEGIPDAPLKNTEDWAMLGFKHALREAVETGKDKVTWTTGEQQADRYDLSKQLDGVTYTKDGRLIAYDKRDPGRDVINEKVPENKIEDYIGKDLAKKLLEAEPEKHNGMRSIIGTGLKVGGEGMRGFYDKILPKAVEKYVKQWGGKVSLEPESGRKSSEHWNVDITPAMRESVESGQPLFQRKAEPTSIKNETVNAERMERNVDELASEHGQANADAWAKAKASAEKDPTYGRRLTQAILANPRPLSKDEVAVLLHDRVRISNEYEAALKDAETKKDPQSLLRLADTERQLNENDNAARLAGTENALGLQGRQMMARQDYSLANMVRRAKIAEGKDTLPQTVMDKLKEISQRIKTADKAIEERNLPRKKTVDEKMQERMKAKIDKLQKTIAERLKACPIQ